MGTGVVTGLRGRARIGAVGIAAAAIVAGVLASGAGAGIGDNDAVDPSVSANGRFVAFSTGADLGGPVNLGAFSNIYVYDRTRDKFELVSRRSASAGGGGANGFNFDPAISATGRYVAFASDATNLGSGGDSGRDVFVYDRRRDKVELVSRRSQSAGGQEANGEADGNAAITPDGRYVAFGTNADNLGGPIAKGGFYNIYVYDRERDRVRLVSRRSQAAGGDGADADSRDPAMSANGRFVAFDSDADNLVVAAGAGHNDVFVYDRRERRVSLVSRRSQGAGGAGADGSAQHPSVSADGRFVAFETTADNLGGPIQAPGAFKVYVYDRKLKRVRLISRRSASAGGAGADSSAADPSMSANGRLIAFDTDADNLGGPIDTAVDNVYVYNRKLRRVSLVSRRSNGGVGGNGDSQSPAISADGAVVAFHGTSTNLRSGGLSNFNVFAYVRQSRTVELISRAP